LIIIIINLVDRIRVTLDQLPFNQPATVERIDWGLLDGREARRLRDLGFEEGAQVETLHKGVLFWRDPIAVRIGRMTVALRKAHASAMEVLPA
jgi:ferrous iron transport protein A